MLTIITFILPGIFDKHCLNYLDDSNKLLMQQLASKLSRSTKAPIDSLQNWLTVRFNLAEEYYNSANLMAAGDGLVSSNEADLHYWLRADPIILTPTHNGILCRGNRILKLTKNERTSIVSLVNEYFSDQAIELKLSTSSQGYLKLTKPVECKFTSLSEVIGQDITHRLPQGTESKYWHGVLTDLQMLVHNCPVNQKRMEAGQPVVSGFWLWADSKSKKVMGDLECYQSLFTDDSALAGAIGKTTNLHKLSDHYQLDATSDSLIHVSQFDAALNQNDIGGWQTLFEQWIAGWLLPSLKAVDEKQLAKVILIAGDGFSYHYSRNSKWCFWRHHSFPVNMKNNITENFL